MDKPILVDDAAPTEHTRELATGVGRAWAKDLADTLRLAGRRTEGGWPGTLSEARGRAALLVSQAALDRSERTREDIARIVYAAARDGWQQWRVKESPEPNTPESDDESAPD